VKKASLVDEVLSVAQARRPGFASWFDRLPAEALLAVAHAFDPARHKQQSYARAIIEAASRRGWQTSGVQGVIGWLKKQRSLTK
jgi:hypothetical protein